MYTFIYTANGLFTNKPKKNDILCYSLKYWWTCVCLLPVSSINLIGPKVGFGTMILTVMYDSYKT